MSMKCLCSHLECSPSVWTDILLREARFQEEVWLSEQKTILYGDESLTACLSCASLRIFSTIVRAISSLSHVLYAL